MSARREGPPTSLNRVLGRLGGLLPEELWFQLKIRREARNIRRHFPPVTGGPSKNVLVVTGHRGEEG